MPNDDPLTCQQCIERIDDYLDDELAMDTRLQVVEHVHHCTRCQSLLLMHKKSIALVRRSVQADPDTLMNNDANDMLARVLSTLSKEQGKKKS